MKAQVNDSVVHGKDNTWFQEHTRRICTWISAGRETEELSIIDSGIYFQTTEHIQMLTAGATNNQR